VPIGEPLMLRIFQEWFFSQDMFFNIYQHSRHFNLETLLMPRIFNGIFSKVQLGAKYHLVENYFQLYINLVDEST